MRPAAIAIAIDGGARHIPAVLDCTTIVPTLVGSKLFGYERGAFGRHRTMFERTISWLTGYCRLNLRYERKAIRFCAFLTLAAALTCFKKLTRAISATWDRV
ncbi:hypothetical protein [Nocardia abscessus]|uniref:hypothetical protein n=1 Tax=Nocardia abscessus TaxID=120957 RepID=UPI002454228F|nr:hypothetical protein [Nocardia abscessus]